MQSDTAVRSEPMQSILEQDDKICSFKSDSSLFSLIQACHQIRYDFIKRIFSLHRSCFNPQPLSHNQSWSTVYIALFSFMFIHKIEQPPEAYCCIIKE